MDLAAQRQEVGIWLEDLFADEVIPEFELNVKTIQQLHDILLFNKKQDKMTQLVVDDLQQKADEYNAESERLCKILCRLNLSQNNLSQSGLNSLRSLAKLGTLLDIKDASDTCYFLALQHLDMELEQVGQKKQSEADLLQQVTAKSQAALLKCSALKKTLDGIKQNASQEQPVNDKRKNDTVFLHSKAKNYGKDITKLQTQLAKSRTDKSIFHEALVKKSEFLKSLQDKLAPLRAELESYSSLPPDLSETKIKVEQQRRELAKLEKQVSECIDISLL
ncbi:HAUS augmin-like complex subunit 1 [Physella acuta]|uniref:HAUS augmin-like complex subunit 1 n=1 Tax=Physella acuta TaxID=109671 RepID=UPI0027DDEF59|nr:HAUS augmin-like complex subunit 1 [Physella acuta]XP_059165086.1 HAUS augmin-like complex subunit 1 [Physella acuta]XP_059165087.1 HAUS augmin-like complex subunit 1 [Physella acuta]XP_059165088.1 HAUS augmin-like complex subunit 1 [Physella acuta]